MLHRLFLVISLALLFGLGQQGAAVHAISHLADSQQRESQQDQKSHHLTFCDQCAAYAALDSAVDADARHPLPVAVAANLFIHGACHRPTGHTHYYTARAPPILA